MKRARAWLVWGLSLWSVGMAMVYADEESLIKPHEELSVAICQGQTRTQPVATGLTHARATSQDASVATATLQRDATAAERVVIAGVKVGTTLVDIFASRTQPAQDDGVGLPNPYASTVTVPFWQRVAVKVHDCGPAQPSAGSPATPSQPSDGLAGGLSGGTAAPTPPSPAPGPIAGGGGPPPAPPTPPAPAPKPPIRGGGGGGEAPSPVVDADEAVRLKVGQSKTANFKKDVLNVQVTSSNPTVASANFSSAYGNQVTIKGLRDGEAVVTVNAMIRRFEVGINAPLGADYPYTKRFHVVVGKGGQSKDTATRPGEPVFDADESVELCTGKSTSSTFRRDVMNANARSSSPGIATANIRNSNEVYLAGVAPGLAIVTVEATVIRYQAGINAPLRDDQPFLKRFLVDVSNCDQAGKPLPKPKKSSAAKGGGGGAGAGGGGVSQRTSADCAGGGGSGGGGIAGVIDSITAQMDSDCVDYGSDTETTSESVEAPAASSSATDSETGVTTTSTTNSDGTSTITKTDQDGNVISTETVPSHELASGSSTDPATHITTSVYENPDGTRTVIQTDSDGNVISKEIKRGR